MKLIIREHKYYRLYVKPFKNRIYFTILGSIREVEDIPLFAEDWKRAVSKVKKNFTILSDVRLMGILGRKVEKVCQEIQGDLIEKGVCDVAEVHSVNDIADLQASHLAERSGLPTTKFESVEEAEIYLNAVADELKKAQIKKRKRIALTSPFTSISKSDFKSPLK